MSKKQANRLKTISLNRSYKNQCLSIAENVFKFDNLPEYIDLSFVNKKLLYNGAIAFFKDEVLGLLALPFVVEGSLDLYGRPRKIAVMGANGYYRSGIEADNFVIVYDNMARRPIVNDIMEYVTRLVAITRVMDTNLMQQKTPRIWVTTSDEKETLKGLLSDIDSDEDTIIGYTNLIMEKLQGVLAPAPYLLDKLQEQKKELWNEFLRLVGVANLNIQKKERLITDEVTNSQGGTLASRFNRYYSRLRGIDEVNKKFGTDIKVSYYDDLENKELNSDESEVDEDV